jgi:hypothetical protein
MLKFPDDETICPYCGGDLKSDEEKVEAQPDVGEVQGVSFPGKTQEPVMPGKKLIAKLVVASMGGFFEYILGEDITNIGRDDPNSHWYPQIKLNEDKSVSRKHCYIVKEADEYFIEDLGSKHGTQLNGEEINGQGKKRLNNGDKITLGEATEITFYLFGDDEQPISDTEREKIE